MRGKCVVVVFASSGSRYLQHEMFTPYLHEGLQVRLFPQSTHHIPLDSRNPAIRTPRDAHVRRSAAAEGGTARRQVLSRQQPGAGMLYEPPPTPVRPAPATPTPPLLSPSYCDTCCLA